MGNGEAGGLYGSCPSKSPYMLLRPYVMCCTNPSRGESTIETAAASRENAVDRSQNTTLISPVRPTTMPHIASTLAAVMTGAANAKAGRASHAGVDGSIAM